MHPIEKKPELNLELSWHFICVHLPFHLWQKCIFFALIDPMQIERSDYIVTVPDGCTVDPEDADIDYDHYTCINLGAGGTLIILVNDDVKGGGKEFETLRNSYHKKLKDPTELPSDLFATRGNTAMIVAGKLDGMHWCFEFGLIEGREKAFILTGSYLQNHPEEGRPILQGAVETFVIKE